LRSGDTLNLLAMRFASGATASVCVNNHAVHGSGHVIECYGDQGSLALKNSTGDYVRGFGLWFGQRGQQLASVPINEPPDPFADGRTLPVAILLRRFIEWVQTGRRAKPDFDDGCRVQALIEAIRAAASQAAWIEVAR
jgi:predicted dehydrogenase